MKRKSILMTIVAVLFAGVAWGQGQLPTWPTGLGTDVKGADTIYFCLKTDSLYPIELGYDVLGKRLSPEWGEWSLYTKTSEDVTVDDYNLDGSKNGGAGNAFKAVGSGKGGLIFQYVANDPQCGLAKGEIFWAYIFLLPDFNGSVSKQMAICYDEQGGDVTIEYDQSFDEYTDLYEKAGFNYTWKVGGQITIKKDSIAQYLLEDTIVLTPDHPALANYTCGLEGIFQISVTVDTIGQLKGIGLGICAKDTLGDLGNTKAIDIFTVRQKYTGTYSPERINNWTDAEKLAKKKLFTFSYDDCKGNSPKMVVDTLYIQEAHGYWGKDTIIACRVNAPSNIFAYYNDDDISYPLIDGKPILDNTNSYWYDRAIGIVPISDKGTTDNNFSMVGVTDPYTDDGTELRKDYMKSNVGYHYLWRVAPNAYPVSCLFDYNGGGKPDSGTIVVILQDPAIAIDYTAQLCKKGTYDFDLNAYTRLDVVWTGANLETDNKTIRTENVYPGTYKYEYSLVSNCGAGGKGIFYLKVTTKIKAPASKTVSYCVEKLPASINLNDVLGVAVSGLTWISDSGLDATDGFDATTGVLDIPTYTSKHGTTPQDLVFETDGASDCDVPNGITLTIKFVITL
jgi:hypothetical protein